jgi:hypothetical protein
MSGNPADRHRLSTEYMMSESVSLPPREERAYRVELRLAGGASRLGEVTGAPPTDATLSLWARRLRRAGGMGKLVLVEKGTEQPIASIDLASAPRYHDPRVGAPRRSRIAQR